MNDAPDFPRRSTRCIARGEMRFATASTGSAGRSRDRGNDVRLGTDPGALRALGSLEFAVKLAREARVAVSPGVGFGPGGDGHVRFALVENEQRIGQAVASLRRALPELAGERLVR